MLYPEVVTALEEEPQLFASLVGDGGNTPVPETWSKNEGFMELLNLAPEGKQDDSNYNMFLMNPEPLLETTPAYSHSKTASAPAGAPAGTTPNTESPAPDDLETQPSPTSPTPDEPFAPSNAPSSGQTATTTTTTTKAPNQPFRRESKK